MVQLLEWLSFSFLIFLLIRIHLGFTVLIIVPHLRINIKALLAFFQMIFLCPPQQPHCPFLQNFTHWRATSVNLNIAIVKKADSTKFQSIDIIRWKEYLWLYYYLNLSECVECFLMVTCGFYGAEMSEEMTFVTLRFLKTKPVIKRPACCKEEVDT